ncbi:MAG: HEAT repeat domain-containing protein [Proteobacteria bacterium]|nr:HEAT repeat domain-containing protein [Pseudomonadota bacterium]
MNPETLSKDIFRSLAEQALGTLKNPSNLSGEIVLNGALEVQDANASLILDVNIRLDQLPIPLKTGIAATGKATDKEKANSLVRAGLNDLAASIKGLFKLVDAEPDRLIRALDSPEPDEQVLALKLLGIQKINKGVPEIARLLDDPRLKVAETAADTLAEIGDEQAVSLLIAAIRRGDLRSEVRAIEAMGRIGGKEAEAYLEMTAVGHEIPEVRHLSETLLSQTRNRKRP